MENNDKNKRASSEDNEIPIEQLPVEIKAYEDENGFAIVITSDEARIGNAQGKLVKTLLVRILGDDIPKLKGVHSVTVDDARTRHVPVADARIDEAGRLFVTSAADGVQRPAAKLEE